MIWLLVAGYYTAGVLCGLLALYLASVRGRLPDGAAVFGLAAFIALWPALLPVALFSHWSWFLEVRASDRQADPRTS